MPASSARGPAGEISLEDHVIAGAQFSKRIKALEGCSKVCEASGVSNVGNCLSSQSHSTSHLSHGIDSSVANSVSLSLLSAPLSVSAAAASSLAGLLAACGAAAVGSVGSVEGGRSCASRNACVGRRTALGGVDGGLSRSCFSLLQSMHVRDDANSCPDTVNLLRVQHSTSYNLQGVVAPDSCRKVRRSCTVGNRSAELTVDMTSPGRWNLCAVSQPVA